MVTQDQNATPTPGETLVEAVRTLSQFGNAAELPKTDQNAANHESLDEALASGEATKQHGGGYHVDTHEINGAEVDRWRKLRAAHGVFQLGIQQADDQQAKAPTVRHFLWWMAAVIGLVVSL